MSFSPSCSAVTAGKVQIFNHNDDCRMNEDKIGKPGTIGHLTVKNRIVMAPMISNLCNPDGSTNESHMAYLEERAKGGAGLIITEYSYIDRKNSRGARNQMGLYTDEFAPKLRRLTERIHNHGANIFVQLVHAGGKALTENNAVWPYAPTAVDYLGTTPAEMSPADIDDAIASFVRAARVAKRSNFDGIELHGAHGYLIQEFLSPALNQRKDRYGGSFEGRIRFAQEIIDAIRSEVDTNLGIRLSLYEDDADGYGPEYGLSIAESLKSVDYVHFSAGRTAPPGSSMSFYGVKTHIAERLPRKPAVTTIVVGSVTNAADARRVLEKADFVAVGRGMLADPYFAEKVLAGDTAIRPCIRCNQACRDLTYGEVRCTVNPSTGLELLVNPLPRVKGEVNVVGAGVKGLEAAICLAKAGLSVTVYDKRTDIGGQLLDIRDKHKKGEFVRLIEYYREVLRKLGVRLKMGQEYSGDGIYCLPDRTYPPIPTGPNIRFDSNIFQHHDEILHLAGVSKVVASERSLNSLDRARAAAFRRLIESKGVVFATEMGSEFDFSISERRQYDIRAAMVSGREAARKYIEDRHLLHA